MRIAWAALCAVLLGAASPSLGARLFVPVAAGPGVAAALPGLSGVVKVALQPAVLADLRSRSDAVLEAFPLGAGGTADLVLTRIEPFPAGARVEVMQPDGPHAIPLPDAAYFAGSVDGDPASRVFLVAGRTEAHGFVATGGDVYPFGPDLAGDHRSYALSRVDPALYPRPVGYCVNDLQIPEALRPPPRPTAGLAPPVAATSGLKLADVAVETDNELRAKFPSDSATLDYLASLLAAATAIYERDVGVRLQFSYIRLWAPAVTDPWTKTDTVDSLYEVQNYWNTPGNNMNVVAGNPDIVHFISGKSVQGGVAYLDVLCNGYWAYGVSQVYGAFDLSDPNNIWDVEVVTHEMGHNFGSPHTHCYNPPLDMCWPYESGCYSGPEVDSRGTIMSYCHLHTGGLANIDLTFGPTVSARIGQSVAAAFCLASVSTTTTTTTSTATTSTSITGTTTTGPTTTNTATTTSTTTVTTTTAHGSTTTSSTGSVPTTTTSTTVPDGDDDEDGVPDAADACPDTPAGDLVDDTGCSVCPCAGPREGGTWRNRMQYLRCVRIEARRRAGSARGAAFHRAQRSSCGRRGMTRCCLYTSEDDQSGSCRLLRLSSCVARGAIADAEDMGDGSCVPSPCPRP
jgi:hypothetical protein